MCLKSLFLPQNDLCSYSFLLGRIAPEALLFCVLADLYSPFVAHRWEQTDGKSELVYYITDGTLTAFLAGPANLRVLLRELGKSALQAGIVGVDASKLLALVEIDDGFLLVLGQLVNATLILDHSDTEKVYH